MRPRISIRGCVRPSVGRSVRRSVGHTRVETTQKCHFCPNLLSVRARTYLMAVYPASFFLHSWFFVNHYLSANYFFKVFYFKSNFSSWFLVSPFFSRDDFFIDVNISLPKSRHSRHFSSFTWFQECREKHSWFVNHVTRVIHATRRSLLDFKGAEKKIMICHFRRSRHTRHSSFVTEFKGWGKSKS